ncbi:MAG: asparagine synthase (glutamine-hydrolyzing) [candidate division Zixibacteria bacterium]|nr:asparagine synthase (glutamine-hydrolyzing) [candidate division Zixibacteria bacterium]MDD5425917.1 asparagine synthase (glutamine-hydrolyzing) [candidate division Zixibacteria bacterium]
MCGIAGIYNLRRKPIPASCLKKMCDVMKHRGPDDEGYVFFHIRNHPFKDESYWMEKGNNLPANRRQEDWFQVMNGNGEFNFALGHRRLAVIDLSSAGHQPMSNRTNGIWVSYNGEIYNYRELRNQLKNQGHHFFSQSDTEVIIHLYEEYGENCFGKLNGIFALALWDGRHNRLYLVRDRYGAKPLYYTIHHENLCFASEIKALLQVDSIRTRLNYRALREYFTFQNTFGDVTLFEGVRLLEPGHFIVVESENMVKKQYWDFNYDEMTDRGENYFIEQLRERFEEAIKRQLVADVPLGSYLSGGLDSGSITALASKFIPRLMTFTGGFDVATAVSIESMFDERQKAELLSRQCGTEHYQMIIHAGDLEWALPRVIWHSEDLRVGMAYPHYYLSRLASKFVKVVLAGPGGDETLGGYPWRYKIFKNCQSSDEFEKATYNYWSRLVADQNFKKFFTPHIQKEFGTYTPFDSLHEVMAKNAFSSFLRKALYVDAKTFLHGILVIEDKLSMAHSLESRVPFLDNELVDFTTRIPTPYLLNDRWVETARTDINVSGKYILRRAMENILPREIIENRKQGFSPPDQSWYMNKLVQYIKDTILSDSSLGRGYFQKEYLEKVLEEHVSGKVNHRLLIWSLLSFEWWNRLFIDCEKIENIYCEKDRFNRRLIFQDSRLSSPINITADNTMSVNKRQNKEGAIK